MEIDELTLHWLAGYLEGEGSFCAAMPSMSNSPFVCVKTTDEDVAEKVATIFGNKHYQGFNKGFAEKGWKQSYEAKMTGIRAIALMNALRPLMGTRRQTQIDNAIASYKGDQLHALSPERRAELQQRARSGENVLELAKEFGVSKSYSYYVRNGEHEPRGHSSVVERHPSKVYVVGSNPTTRSEDWGHSSMAEQLAHNELDLGSSPSAPTTTLLVNFPLQIQPTTLYWLAGILEGEGSFMAGSPSSPNTPKIVITTTDEDIAERVAQIFGVKCHQVSARREGAKIPYMVSLRSSTAHDFMRALYPLMSQRRQSQIEKALENYRYSPRRSLTTEEVKAIKKMLFDGIRIKDIAAELGVGYESVRDIKRRRNYKTL